MRNDAQDRGWVKTDPEKQTGPYGLKTCVFEAPSGGVEPPTCGLGNRKSYLKNALSNPLETQ